MVRHTRQNTPFKPLDSIPSLGVDTPGSTIVDRRRLHRSIHRYAPGARVDTPMGTRVDTPIGARIDTPIGARIDTPIGARIDAPIGSDGSRYRRGGIPAPARRRLDAPDCMCMSHLYERDLEHVKTLLRSENVMSRTYTERANRLLSSPMRIMRF